MDTSRRSDNLTKLFLGRFIPPLYLLSSAHILSPITAFLEVEEVSPGPMALSSLSTALRCPEGVVGWCDGAG